ncbi:hypothetical protein [Actinomycetospora chibensis]|uniref:Secreted protein n=1 Tax=Actinomycetospora chibensis TaxID=663606 RepID=A0ABV9RI18_9PSEU|nr:hypothetical protein [Actinomycetospora chibensis]MDD7927186.1 hypothetical protein [Actinomycetospora chibensis]
MSVEGPLALVAVLLAAPDPAATAGRSVPAFADVEPAGEMTDVPADGSDDLEVVGRGRVVGLVVAVGFVVSAAVAPGRVVPSPPDPAAPSGASAVLSVGSAPDPSVEVSGEPVPPPDSAWSAEAAPVSSSPPPSVPVAGSSNAYDTSWTTTWSTAAVSCGPWKRMPAPIAAARAVCAVREATTVRPPRRAFAIRAAFRALAASAVLAALVA